MRKILLMGLLVTLSATAGCFGSLDQTCDEVRDYQLAREGRRIEVPERLDPLDELKEIPLPKASPRPDRPPGSRCLDLPPSILGGEG